MTIEIVPLVKDKELYRHYDRQTSVQGCYVEIDCGRGLLLASYNAEIGNAVPMSVYHGHDQRFGIPCLTNDAANALLVSLRPLAERVVDGYESYWDGHNMVARFSEDATKALEEIGGICDGLDEEEGVEEWDAGDYLQCSIHHKDSEGVTCKYHQAVTVVIDGVGTITGRTTDEELGDLEGVIEAGLDSNQVLHNLGKFLRDERDNCRSNFIEEDQDD